MGKRGEAREKILASAFELFYLKGFTATGLDDILEHSGTGKSQLYHYFGSKEGLALAMLQQFSERLKSGEMPISQDLKTWEQFESWFDFFIEGQRATGCVKSCPVATVAVEFNNDQADLLAVAQDIFEWTSDLFVRFFEMKKAEGELPSKVDSQSLADYCVVIMQGGLLLAKIRRESTPFEHAVAQARDHVRQLRCQS